jgi:hypothetical protein
MIALLLKTAAMSSFALASLRMPAGEARSEAIPERAVLVELFTSEGCSSCPPADAVLSKLEGMRVGGGVLIVGLSEHVTYWNRLGWADPFSQELFTQRQNGYGYRFALDSIYTPQVVVGGVKEMSGGDEAGIRRAVEEAGGPSGVGLRVTSVEPTAKGVRVAFALDGKLPADSDLFAVIAQDKATTSVKRGENAGRTLAHVAVARSMARVGKLGAERSFEVPVPDGLDGGRHVVVFVQEKGLRRVLAVGSSRF